MNTMNRNKFHRKKRPNHAGLSSNRQLIGTFDPSLLACQVCCIESNLTYESFQLMTPAKSIENLTTIRSRRQDSERDLSPNTVILKHFDETNSHEEVETLVDNRIGSPNEKVESVDDNDNRHEILKQPLHREVSAIVRSSFLVKGICCASEVPAIKKIVRLAATKAAKSDQDYAANEIVLSIQINIAMKQVYVKHMPNLLSTETLASNWTNSGFTVTLINSETLTGDSSDVEKDSCIGISIFQIIFVASCQSASKIWIQLDEKLKGKCKGFDAITSIEIEQGRNDFSSSSTSTRVNVSARHNICYLTASDLKTTLEELFLLDILNEVTSESICVTIVQDAQIDIASKVASTFMQQMRRSSFVESTFRQQIRDDKNKTIFSIKHWDSLLTENFDVTNARAIRVANVQNILLLKVEHNPESLSARSIATILSKNSSTLFDVLVDGELEKIYLPSNMKSQENLQSNFAQNGKQKSSDKMSYSQKIMAGVHEHVVKLHVTLSGIFWIVALISTIGQHESLLRCSGLLSVIFGLPPVAMKALRTIQRFQFDANCMMVMAAVGAVILGEYDEAASVSFLFAVSELLETRASVRARNALSEIISLCPDYAHVIHPETKEVAVVLAEEVPMGSYISVRTGDKVPTDGIVVEGTSMVDQSSLTGESLPLSVTVNSFVSSGCINIGESPLIVRTTARLQDSTVCRLIRLIEEAQLNSSPTEKMIDAFAKAYTPVVVTIAILMSTISWLFGPEIGRYWTLNGLIVIVISCPCALTISTPVTYTAGLAATAKRGILVKNGSSLEAMGRIDQIVFDKTGTITEGRFQVSELETIGCSYSRAGMLALLALVEAPSSHPLSSTLVQAARLEGVLRHHNMKMEEHVILKGEGVTALVDNKRVYVGNQRLFDRVEMYGALAVCNKERIQKWDSDGGTVGFIGVEGDGIIGCYSLIDTIRPGAKDTVAKLQKMGKSVLMLTGDGEGAAEKVAKKVGIPLESVHAKLLPEDKMEFVLRMKKPISGKNKSFCNWLRPKHHFHSKVLFLGDGINDVAAIASADVGVSMGQGSAIALEMSDVTLMDCNLLKLVYAIEMGMKVVRTIQENIVLSFLCKIIVVVLTFSGHMTLLYAIASDVGVMLLVTMNGMKLLPAFNAKVEEDSLFSRFSSQEVPSRIINNGTNNIKRASILNASDDKLSGRDSEDQFPATNEYETLIGRGQSGSECELV